MRNKFEIRGDVTAIFIKDKYGRYVETLIDTADLSLVDEFPNTWHLSKGRKTYYVVGYIYGVKCVERVIPIHRLIMQPAANLQVDHINHDTLDNRRSNLRNVTTAENAQNKSGARIDNLSSGILGVSWNKRLEKWHAYVDVNFKRHHLGFHADIRSAEKAVINARARLLPYSKEARKHG